VASCCSVSPVAADGPPGPSLLLPFHGRLESNGVAVEDPLDVTFTLLDAATDGNELWSDTLTVAPDSGRFGVVLGEQTALPTSLRTQNTVFIEVRIGGQVIGTRSRLHPSWQAVTSNGAVNADYALYADEAGHADGNDTGTFTIAKNSNTSRIEFAAESNDQGSIVHFEDNNNGDLWLSSSDDWDVSATGDEIIFGEYPNHRRFVVNGAGDGWFDGNLAVDGQVSFGSLSGFTITGEYTAAQNNSAGTDTTNMTSASTSICFLVQTDFEDLDDVSERGGCRINNVSGTWQLQAYLQTNNNADAWCEARCLRWD
jgi:hypothetical protein